MQNTVVTTRNAVIRLLTVLSFSAIASGVFVSAAHPVSVNDMRGRRRVLLIASPRRDSPQARDQQAFFAAWRAEAAARDVSLVEVEGSRVTGASDTAASLLRRYRLDPAAFQVLLIGKDGHVALRSPQPVSASMLQRTIDAMPMRRAGQR